MPLIFITGTSTSGKSAMARELISRGLEAHDLEHNGISAWFHKVNGTRDAEFGKVPERTKEWADAHEWRVSMEWINDIAEKAKSKTIFLCGGGANERDVIAFCDTVIWLMIDEDTIRSRVAVPRDHTYGTRPHELTEAIERNRQKEKEYREIGAIIIDARRSVEEVIRNIITAIESSSLTNT